MNSNVADSRYLQEASALFRAPQEIRDDIYKLVFTSTQITHSHPLSAREKPDPPPKPPPHPLALLLTCRRARNEIQNSWIPHVLFHYETPSALHKKLPTTPGPIIPHIRHLRIGPIRTSCLYPPGHKTTSPETQPLALLSSAIKPATLSLSTLTIIRASSYTAIDYGILEGIIWTWRGWKELRWIHETADLVAYACGPITYQPAEWRRVMAERDGASTGSSVDIYRAGVAGTDFDASLTGDEEYWGKFEQTESPWGGYGDADGYVVVPGDELERRVMVVVRRGEGVAYEATGGVTLEERKYWSGVEVGDGGDLLGR